MAYVVSTTAGPTGKFESFDLDRLPLIENRTPRELAQEGIARSERNERLRAEMREQANRQMRDRQLADLHQASIRNEQFRNASTRSARFAAQRQLLDSALAHLSPPPPPPEPTVVVVQEDDGSADFGSRNFDVAKWAKKPRSWF